MNELGIKIDMELPLSMGVLKVSESRYRAGTEHVGMTLAEMIVTAEEYLCDKYSAEVIKRQEKNDKLRKKRLKAKLEDYLENALHFRDYDIHDENFFGRLNIVAVHQKVDADNLEGYVENAIEGFHRDGFGKVVFYV